MASHHGDNDVALSHAGLLAYFHPNTPILHPEDEERVPPSYGDCNASQVTLVLDHGDRKNSDEESIYGLSTVKRDHCGFYDLCCFWCAVSVCILCALGMFFALDVAFSQFGMGTGLAMGMVRGSTSQANASYEVSSNPVTYLKIVSLIQFLSQMNFCLASPNRQAPGPQTWRYIRPDNIASCTTEVVTLSAASTEQWKLRLDDESLFGDDLPVNTGFEQGGKFMHVDEKVRMSDLRGDVAEESETTLWDLYSRGDEIKSIQE